MCERGWHDLALAVSVAAALEAQAVFTPERSPTPGARIYANARVVAIDAQSRTITVRSGGAGKDETFPVEAQALQRVGALKPPTPARPAPPARPSPAASPAAASPAPSPEPTPLPTDIVGPQHDPRRDPNFDPRQNPLRDPRVVPGLSEPVPSPTPTPTPPLRG